MFRFFFLTTLFLYCTGQEIAQGCKTPDYIKNPDFEKLSGDWYIYAATPILYGKAKCEKYKFAEHELSEWPFIVSWKNVNTNKMDTVEDVFETFNDQGYGEAKMGSVKWYLLNTDSDEFLVFYHCKDLSGYLLEKIEILSRQPFPDENVIKEAKKTLEKANLSTEGLENKDQKNCD